MGSGLLQKGKRADGSDYNKHFIVERGGGTLAQQTNQGNYGTQNKTPPSPPAMLIYCTQDYFQTPECMALLDFQNQREQTTFESKTLGFVYRRVKNTSV